MKKYKSCSKEDNCSCVNCQSSKSAVQEGVRSKIGGYVQDLSARTLSTPGAFDAVNFGGEGGTALVTAGIHAAKDAGKVALKAVKPLVPKVLNAVKTAANYAPSVVGESSDNYLGSKEHFDDLNQQRSDLQNKAKKEVNSGDPKRLYNAVYLSHMAKELTKKIDSHPANPSNIKKEETELQEQKAVPLSKVVDKENSKNYVTIHHEKTERFRGKNNVASHHYRLKMPNGRVVGTIISQHHTDKDYAVHHLIPHGGPGTQTAKSVSNLEVGPHEALDKDIKKLILNVKEEPKMNKEQFETLVSQIAEELMDEQGIESLDILDEEQLDIFENMIVETILQNNLEESVFKKGDTVYNKGKQKVQGIEPGVPHKVVGIKSKAYPSGLVHTYTVQHPSGQTYDVNNAHMLLSKKELNEDSMKEGEYTEDDFRSNKLKRADRFLGKKKDKEKKDRKDRDDIEESYGRSSTKPVGQRSPEDVKRRQQERTKRAEELRDLENDARALAAKNADQESYGRSKTKVRKESFNANESLEMNSPDDMTKMSNLGPSPSKEGENVGPVQKLNPPAAKTVETGTQTGIVPGKTGEMYKKITDRVPAVESAILEVMKKTSQKNKMYEDAQNIAIINPEQRLDWLEVHKGSMNVLDYINKYKV